jgi:hypothetical protein
LWSRTFNDKWWVFINNRDWLWTDLKTEKSI